MMNTKQKLPLVLAIAQDLLPDVPVQAEPGEGFYVNRLFLSNMVSELARLKADQSAQNKAVC